MSTPEEELAVMQLTVLVNKNDNFLRYFLKHVDKNQIKEKLAVEVNCDEVYPNIFLGNEKVSFEMSTSEDELAAMQLMMLANKNTNNLFKYFFKNLDKSKIQEKLAFELNCDEVYPNIFIGNEGSAKNKGFLKEHGITHVVNTAEGNVFSQVNTNEDYYKDISVKYLGLNLMDETTTNISLHFNEVADFIEDALKGNGKVLVHCFMGMSRSATSVLAYLIIKKKMSAEEAVKTVSQHRFIRPNQGFLLQLVQLDNKLNKERNGEDAPSRL